MSINGGQENVLYEYADGSRTFILTDLGTHYIREGGQCQTVPWFKDTRTGKPMIPAKRRSFVSLVKQGIREGDYTK